MKQTPIKERKDWGMIQKDYDNGMGTEEIIIKYKIASRSLTKASKVGLFKIRTQREGLKMWNKTKPQKHSEETKQKISKRRKEYLRLNPDKVPYLLNHKNKRKFYSEEYFQECLKNTNFTKEYKINLYSLDFADLNNKIDLEIDGDQHFLDKRIVIHDTKRNLYLLSLGWTIIRVKWSEFQKLSRNEKENIIDSIKLFQNPNVSCITFIKP